MNKHRLPAVMFCALAVSAFLGLSLGSRSIPLSQVWAALGSSDLTDTSVRIIKLVRLPRVLGGIAAGCALSLAGAVIQNVLRNPLASSGIIGVNAGAGFMAAVCSALLPLSVNTIPAAAMAGAVCSVLLILLIAERSQTSGISVILAGIAVSAIFTAGTEAIIAVVPDALTGWAQFRIGSLSNLSMSRILPACMIICIVSTVVLLLAPMLDILMLGDDTARSLGMNAKKVRIALLICAALLAGSAVSYCGLIGFAGLIVPHIIRRFTGDDNRILLPSCMLAGGSFIVLCDTAGRCLFAPYEIPVGILLSLAGGPFFIYLILSRKGGGYHA